MKQTLMKRRTTRQDSAELYGAETAVAYADNTRVGPTSLPKQGAETKEIDKTHVDAAYLVAGAVAIGAFEGAQRGVVAGPSGVAAGAATGAVKGLVIGAALTCGQCHRPGR